MSKIHGKTLNAITPDAMNILSAYNWPGNIRELINCLESSVVMTNKDVLDVECLPSFLLDKVNDIMEAKAKEEMEAESKSGVDSLSDAEKRTGGSSDSTNTLFKIEKKITTVKLELFEFLIMCSKQKNLKN